MSISALGGASNLLAYSSAARNGVPGSAASSSNTGAAAESYLMGYANMTPAQQMQASILSSMGITPAQYAQMSPQEQAKIQQQVQQKLKQEVDAQTEKKSGMIVDMHA
jgi:hypothetical protein